MKITTYNPDGSIKEVREHHVQIPEYINSFDAKHSFLNITEEDVNLVQFKRKDFEKDLLLNQYRFLLRYDYDNYLKNNACKIYIEDERGRINNEETLEYYDHVLSLILNNYRLQYEYPVELPDQARRLLNDSLWIDTLLYHAKKAKNRIQYKNVTQEQNPLTNNLIGIIHRLYYALRTANKFGHLGENEQKVMFSLYPFANLQSMKLTKRRIFDNDNVLIKLIESMYLTKEECRFEMYSIADAIESSVHLGNSKVNNSSIGFVAMMTNNTSTNNEEAFTIEATPSNSFEITKIELPKEEIVCLRCHKDISKNVLEEIGNALRKEYKLFDELNGEDTKNATTQKALRHFHFSSSRVLTRSRWRDFYFISLNNLETEYKSQYDKIKDYSVPYYYYYLLVNTCTTSQRYDFTDYFLESLIYMAEKNKCIQRSYLYEQMVRLNFMEEEAEIIKKGNDSVENDTTKTKMENLKEKLLSGDQAEIAECIYEKSESDIKNTESLIERIMTFFIPLFDDKYVIGMKVKAFQILFKRILSNSIISEELKEKNGEQPFNLKLVLNIIGFLSRDNKTYKSKVKNPPLDEHIGPKLISDLIELWSLDPKIKDNYHKSVEQFSKKIDNKFAKNASFTKFTLSIKNAVEEEWRRYFEEQSMPYK